MVFFLCCRGVRVGRREVLGGGFIAIGRVFLLGTDMSLFFSYGEERLRRDAI